MILKALFGNDPLEIMQLVLSYNLYERFWLKSFSTKLKNATIFDIFNKKLFGPYKIKTLGEIYNLYDRKSEDIWDYGFDLSERKTSVMIYQKWHESDLHCYILNKLHRLAELSL